MPTLIRDTFSYLVLTLAAAFTVMVFIPARFYAVGVAPPTPAIASIAQSTIQVARPRHHRSWHPAAPESVDGHTAAAAMLALMLVKTQTQGSQP
jgi:cobalamin biosynthesis protein CobD/CbiB